MRNAIAETRNLTTLARAAEALRARQVDLPGIAAIVGSPGVGKTMGAVWLRDQTDAVFVRAKSVWTTRSLIDDMARELRVDVGGRRGVVFDRVVERLAITGRPVIVDEADYLLDRSMLLDAMRDLHDLSGVPLFVIGMERFSMRVERHEQFASRIARTIEFGWADLADARAVADTCCEVAFDDDLLARIVEQTAGSLRRIKVALAQIETWADRKGVGCVTLADWGAQAIPGAVAKARRGGAR